MGEAGAILRRRVRDLIQRALFRARLRNSPSPSFPRTWPPRAKNLEPHSPSNAGAISPAASRLAGGAVYATTCAALSFAFLALFIRFATHRRWLFDSLSDNEYGMYLVHYMLVSWLQFALLPIAFPALAEAATVFLSTLFFSLWATSTTLRSISITR